MNLRQSRLVALTFALLTSGPGIPAATLTASAQTPVILISVDTLRADHLSAYGYRSVKTPALDLLRRDSILFESAYTNVPLTLPAHASILTGLLPAEHGIRDNSGYRLKASVETLPSVLKASGYATGGAVSSVVLSRRSGISGGFDFFDDAIEPTAPGQGAGQLRRAGTETARILTSWISSVSGRPFFAFLHLYEPHAPYESPEPFRSHYAGLPYDGAIAAADAAVGSFLEFLKRTGLYDRCLIVFLSDHGEGLGEHGEDEHGIFLYREALSVPLFIKLPASSRAGTSVSGRVGINEVLATVAREVGARVPKGLGRRASLLDVSPSVQRPPVFSETLFPRVNCGWSDLKSLIDGDWHYIEAPHPELYNLRSDPGEKRNLFDTRPPVLRALKLQLDKVESSFQGPLEADAEQAAKLRSLGYLSGGVASSGGPLPDPKDRIGTYREMKRAFALLDAKQDEDAVVLLRKILKENPGMLDLWSLCAQALLSLGRPEEAAAALKQGLDPAPPTAAPAFLRAADLYARMGRLDDAVKQAERAAAAGDPEADTALAQIHLARGEIDRAETFARRAMTTSSFPRIPTLILARVELARGNAGAALTHLDRIAGQSVERRLAPLVAVQQIRGAALEKLGRRSEAETAYREEVRLFPFNGDAWTALALLQRSEKGPAATRLVLAEMVAANPSPMYYQRAFAILTATGDREGADELRRKARAQFPRDSRF